MSENDQDQTNRSFTRRMFIRMAAIAGAAISAPWLRTARVSAAPAAAASEADVLAAFTDAVKAFNNKQADALKALLDPGVVLRKVHQEHQRPVITGQQEVIAYLKGAWYGTPPVEMIFDPNSGGATPKVIMQGANAASVKGLACWKDNDGDNADGELKYEFKLQNSNGSWLVTSLYGTLTGKPCPA